MMRILLAIAILFHLVECSALAQEGIVVLASQQSLPQSVPEQSVPQARAPQARAPQQNAPQTRAPQQSAPQQSAPQQRATQQATPQADPFMDDPAPPKLDSLDLDSNQSFNFNDSADTQSSNASDFQSSIASNSNFRGASPQMIGDFGGGSLMKTIGGGPFSNLLTAPIPLAGGSRRIKIAENNQVMPEDRIYGTFNYFHNAYQAIGSEGVDYSYPVNVVDSESLAQYTLGFEKKFCAWGTPFSIDVRMPFTGGVSQDVVNSGSVRDTRAVFETGSMGNLSTAFKVYLLEVKQTSITGGLGMSLPTGSLASAATFLTVPDSANNPQHLANLIDVDNSAVHLMPFLGAYRQIGNSSWLQAFTQIDVVTGGNKGRQLQFADDDLDGSYETLLSSDDFILNDQNLLYADVSFGKWWYRNVCDCGRPECTCRQRGLTGVASILELHYTGSLNDADRYFTEGNSNRFNVLNLTTGLMVEFNEQLRINLAGVFPLRERGLDANGRREDQFFDSEFSLQVNYLY